MGVHIMIAIKILSIVCLMMERKVSDLPIEDRRQSVGEGCDVWDHGWEGKTSRKWLDDIKDGVRHAHCQQDGAGPSTVVVHCRAGIGH